MEENVSDTLLATIGVLELVLYLDSRVCDPKIWVRPQRRPYDS